MKIKIDKGRPSYWYAELAGQIFEVVDDGPFDDYILKEDFDKGPPAMWRHILKSDATVLLDAPTTRIEFLWPDVMCPKCRKRGLDATIDADACTVTLTCSECFRSASLPITREEALQAIAEREKAGA